MSKKVLSGLHSVKSAVKNNVPIEIIYCKKGITIPKTLIPIKIVDNNFLNQITKTNHQGVVAILKDFSYFDFESIKNDNPNLVLILDHIQDPQNFGSILRTSKAFGVKHVIIPKDRSVPVTPTVLKVAAGGQIDLKIIKVKSLNSTIDNLKKINYWIYGSTLASGSQSIENVPDNSKIAIVVGNEHSGISKSIAKSCDVLMKIPFSGDIDSLNVGVATGIILYSLTRVINK